MDSNIIFRFLRQFLYDKDFEETKQQLIESKALLVEYKDFIQNEKKEQESQTEVEKKKVDPDFLVMVWASIGLALTIGAQAASQLPKISSNNISDFGVNEIVWLIVALYMVFYIVYNGLFAMSLTLDYAKSKKNYGYRDFAITLITGIILLLVGIILIAQFGNNQTPSSSL